MRTLEIVGAVVVGLAIGGGVMIWVLSTAFTEIVMNLIFGKNPND